MVTTALAAALIGAIGVMAHRAGSSPSAPSPAAEAPSAAQVAFQKMAVEVAMPPAPSPPPTPHPVIALAPSPQVPQSAPRSRPAVNATPARAASRQRELATDRDAVLNPFE